MSAATRQHTCPACGHDFVPDENFHVEPVIELDTPIRWVAVHNGESTFVHREDCE